eukprot:3188599-Amphidinium_carterae.1
MWVLTLRVGVVSVGWKCASLRRLALEARTVCIAAILHTDNAHHFDMVSTVERHPTWHARNLGIEFLVKCIPKAVLYFCAL